MGLPPFNEGGALTQPGQEEQGGFGVPNAQQQHAMGQQMDPSQQQNPFPGPPQQSGPGASGSQAGGDQKTTLWYVGVAILSQAKNRMC